MQADLVIANLKKAYNSQSNVGHNRTMFDFLVNQYVNGDHNKQLRQEIIKVVTGQSKPLTQCTIFAVSNCLRNNFDQLSIF